MSCNNIHNELKKEYILCPFCNEKLQDCSVKYHSCCDIQDIIYDNGTNVCRSCGVVHHYQIAKEFINYYESKYKFQRKSVYHRKYHLYNKVDFLSSKNGVQISFKDKDKIIQIFNEIDKILPQISSGRKRMISINYLLRNIFLMLDLPVERISISKSKKHWLTMKNIGLIFYF